MWQIHAPFWGWAIASILLGLGFTFFSGATEAWLVDALTATGFQGTLERVFGRGADRSAVRRCSCGSVAGGFVAQATNLGVPYLLRAACSASPWWWRCAACTTSASPRSATVARWRQCGNVMRGSIDGGLRNPPVRWLMLAAPFSAGVGIYVFYAFQPYLLQLFGDPQRLRHRRPRRGHRGRRADRWRVARAADPAASSAGGPMRSSLTGGGQTSSCSRLIGLTGNFWLALALLP